MSSVLAQVSSELSGVVSHLCFADTHVAGSGANPAIFASTMGSSIIRYSISLPDPRKRLTELNKAFISGIRYVIIEKSTNGNGSGFLMLP